MEQIRAELSYPDREAPLPPNDVFFPRPAEPRIHAVQDAHALHTVDAPSPEAAVGATHSPQRTPISAAARRAKIAVLTALAIWAFLSQLTVPLSGSFRSANDSQKIELDGEKTASMLEGKEIR